MNIAQLKQYIKDLPDDMEVKTQDSDWTEFSPMNVIVFNNKFYV
jgi:hypothetical protein